MSTPAMKPIGGTDAAAIMGISTRKSGFDVFVERMEPELAKASDEPNERMEWGNIHEPAILTMYGKRENAMLVRAPLGTFKDLEDRRPLAATGLPWWWGGHPDAIVAGYIPPAGLPRDADPKGLIAPLPRVVVEAKSADSDEDWGEPYTDAVPLEHLVQGQWYAPLMDAGRIDWPVLFRGNRMLIYRADFDPELKTIMEDAVGGFVEKFLLTGTAPTAEYTERAARYVRRKYPVNQQPMRTIEDPEQAEIVTAWARQKILLSQAEKVEKTAKLQLQLLIGDAEGASVPGGPAVTWRKAKDTVDVNWEQVARWVGQQANVTQESFMEVVKMFSKTEPGSRRMLLKGAKE